jgi:hypothetical protein
VSTGVDKAPVYVKPTMSWANNDNSSTAGPIFTFTFNDTSITGAAIPAATDSVSGIVTTGAQTMTGEKTWMNTTHASSIYPRTSGTYSLGSTSMLWNGLYARHISVNDDNKVDVLHSLVQTVGTTATQGISGLVIGNNRAEGSAGNSKGYLVLYSNNVGSCSIGFESATSSSYEFTIPSAKSTGYVTISSFNPITTLGYSDIKTENHFYLPFYGWKSKEDRTINGFLNHNSGYRLYAYNGREDSTTAG